MSLRAQAESGPGKTAPIVNAEKVLETAAGLFAKLGYQGVSMRDIGRDSGCATPSIYYHFASKENLYAEAYDSVISATAGMAASRLRGITDKRARCEAMVEMFFDMFRGNRVLFLLVQRDVVEAASGSGPLQCKRYFVHFTQLISEVAGEFRGAPLRRETALAVASLISGFVTISVATQDIYGNDADALSSQKKELTRAVMRLIDDPGAYLDGPAQDGK